MDDDNAISVKVVLLGEAAVGKTCIISRFIHDTFDFNVAVTAAAMCVGKSITIPEFPGKCIRFEIWDTAGQEKYRSLTKIFYKDAKVAILVYDITKRKSFEEIKNYWYNQIKECAPENIIIGVAANKSDLFEEEKVSYEEGKKFANEIGAIFRLTSAYKSTGIEELFKAIGCAILDPDFIDDDTVVKNKIDINENKRKDSVKLNKQEVKKKKKCC